MSVVRNVRNSYEQTVSRMRAEQSTVLGPNSVMDLGNAQGVPAVANEVHHDVGLKLVPVLARETETANHG